MEALVRRVDSLNFYDFFPKGTIIEVAKLDKDYTLRKRNRKHLNSIENEFHELINEEIKKLEEILYLPRQQGRADMGAISKRVDYLLEAKFTGKISSRDFLYLIYSKYTLFKR